MGTRPRNRTEDLPLTAVRVTSLTPVGREAFVLRIPRCADFIPGQVIGITTTPAIQPRLFSLCSGTDDPYWDILFNIKHDGLLSPQLACLKPGQDLHVSMPFGSFIDQQAPAWWIAAGTGIAPFRAMLRSGLASGKHLIHGARRATGFYFAEEFLAALPGRYTRCCSQDTASQVYAGRLTCWLQEQTDLPANGNYLLCGSAEMVVEVRDILIDKQIPIEQIRSEIYF
jgi:ferredoxin/flavodoxin---NADP+ reductase